MDRPPAMRGCAIRRCDFDMIRWQLIMVPDGVVYRYCLNVEILHNTQHKGSTSLENPDQFRFSKGATRGTEMETRT